MASVKQQQSDLYCAMSPEEVSLHTDRQSLHSVSSTGCLLLDPWSFVKERTGVWTIESGRSVWKTCRTSIRGSETGGLAPLG